MCLGNPLGYLYSSLQLVAVGLAWVLHLLFTYLAQRDYWSLLFLALLGISLEYNYCLKDHLLLAVNPGAVIRGPLVGGTY